MAKTSSHRWMLRLKGRSMGSFGWAGSRGGAVPGRARHDNTDPGISPDSARLGRPGRCYRPPVAVDVRGLVVLGGGFSHFQIRILILERTLLRLKNRAPRARSLRPP